MSARLLLMAIAAALTAAPVVAQSAAVMPAPEVVIESPPPMSFSNSVFGDPYATVGVPPANSWISSLPSLPTISLTSTPRNRFWFRAEYLRWWTEGMYVPPLVTTSPDGTAQDEAGVLGQDGTSIVFGGTEINGSSENGFRARTGYWIRPERNWAIESEFFFLGEQNDGFLAGSDGTAIIGIPYFNIVSGAEDAQLVSYPGVVSGSTQTLSETDLKSFLINARGGLCPMPLCGFGPDDDRVDWIIGYRYVKFDDHLAFVQNLTSLTPSTSNPDQRLITERFDARNEFNGMQLGFTYLANFRRVWLESLLRVAIGSNKQTVRIAGSSELTENGTVSAANGGLFAQSSNIGTFQRNQFTMLPELGFTLGVRISERIQATLGYSLLYFPGVVRSGDQMSRDLNPNQFPPATAPFAGAARPAFQFVESSYWTQGINLGGEFRF